MDQAWGYVDEVLDGDTLVMRITSVSRHNAFELGQVERVRLRRENAPELSQWGGKAARERLRERVAGRRVRIDVFARDRYGRALANLSTNPWRRNHQAEDAGGCALLNEDTKGR